MKTKTYQESIKEHLSTYKRNHFEKLKDGIWKRNGNSYSHILPEDHKHKNLLDSDCEAYLKSNRLIKLHRDFHHLNSSQAMCINFFYPLIKEKKLETVLQVLGLQDESIDYESACFEKESDIEKNRRATSFDFYFKTNKGIRIFFEIKYTEQEFGKAKHDNEHIEKYESVYSKHCSSINNDYCNLDSFLKNYQLMRNIIHVSEKDFVVFVYPTGNIKIKQQAEFAKHELVKPEFQSHVICLTWEHLLGVVDNSLMESDYITKQMSDFKDKYFITPIN